MPRNYIRRPICGKIIPRCYRAISQLYFTTSPSYRNGTSSAFLPANFFTRDVMHVYPAEFTPRIPTKMHRYEARESRDRRGRIVIGGGRSSQRNKTKRRRDLLYGISRRFLRERENWVTLRSETEINGSRSPRDRRVKKRTRGIYR